MVVLHLSTRNIIRSDMVSGSVTRVSILTSSPWNIVNLHIVTHKWIFWIWTEVFQLTLSFGTQWRLLVEALIRVPWRLSFELLVIFESVRTHNVMSLERQALTLWSSVKLLWLTSVNIIVAQLIVRSGHLLLGHFRFSTFDIGAVQSRKIVS